MNPLRRFRHFYNRSIPIPPPKFWGVTIRTTSPNETYSINIASGSGVNVQVDWCDLTIETFTTTGVKTHTFITPGVYKVRILASFTSGGNIRVGSPKVIETSVIPKIPGLVSFQSTFENCPSLKRIPPDLFRYNTLVSTGGFSETFSYCTSLTTIPPDLFRYNTLVSDQGFSETFSYCTSLTTLPPDLFRYNTLVSMFGFYGTFFNCFKLILRSDIFGPPEEYPTRFLNKTSSFDYFAYLETAYEGSQPGTAPALWLYDFGTQTPSKTSCFGGHSEQTLTNYTDIPADWK